MRGGVNLETVATFTNYAAPPGVLKVCKIAGPGVKVGTPFSFWAFGGSSAVFSQINAGPPPGGSCQIVGTWPVNTPVTVAETPIPSGVSVSNVTVNPPNRGGPPNLSGGYVVATIGSGITEVDFTDVIQPPGACSGQSLITIDPVNYVGYVPIYTKDTSGNARVAVVNLASGVVGPLISLPGAVRVLSTTYNPNNNTMLAEAVTNGIGSSVAVYEISTNTKSLLHKVLAPGLNPPSQVGGGIVEDYLHNRAFVGSGLLKSGFSTPHRVPNLEPRLRRCGLRYGRVGSECQHRHSLCLCRRQQSDNRHDSDRVAGGLTLRKPSLWVRRRRRCF